jgi:hypothetical protein
MPGQTAWPVSAAAGIARGLDRRWCRCPPMILPLSPIILAAGTACYMMLHLYHIYCPCCCHNSPGADIEVDEEWLARVMGGRGGRQGAASRAAAAAGAGGEQGQELEPAELGPEEIRSHKLRCVCEGPYFCHAARSAW